MIIKRLSCIAILVLALVFLQACGRVGLQPIPTDGVILAFGDSLTVGVGTEKSKSYPSVLASLSGRQVINAGVSGEVSADGVSRLDSILSEKHVDLLILLEGGNDILRNQNPERTKQNLAKMIEIAKAYQVEVVLVGVPEKKLFSGVAPFYKELAEEYKLVFEADLIGDLLRQPKYKSDSIHFNAAGYRVMAEALHELLLERGAL
ncbi:Lysophospholipase L1 [Alteromonadaceae bacterium Bs31]|nr:Lysophospholipase L1 [Alteromonadaceae bacterium Bs31]